MQVALLLQETYKLQAGLTSQYELAAGQAVSTSACSLLLLGQSGLMIYAAHAWEAYS